MVTLFEFRQRIREELDKEIREIGTGGCFTMDNSVDQVAMAYQERTGYVKGLEKALQVMEEMARDQ